MTGMGSMLDGTLIAVGTGGGAALALWFGHARGARARAQAAAAADVTTQVGVVVGALLGLLGLLLGFSFAGASARFVDRQQLVLREANALGTAWLRADLLEEPSRAELREAFRSWAGHRVELAGTTEPAELERLDSALDADGALAWKVASAGRLRTQGTAVLVLGSVNELIDLQDERKAAAKLHLPLAVVGLLAAAALVAVATIGFADGLLGSRHRVFSYALAGLVAAAVWLTIDLDHPREGLTRVDQAPMLEAAAGLH